MTRALTALVALLSLTLAASAQAGAVRINWDNAGTPDRAAAEPDRSMFILLDTSGSMSGSSSNSGMVMAKEAVGRLLDSMKHEDYRLGLIKASGDNVVVAPGTGQIERIRPLIDFGHGSGNPITSLASFHERVLPRHPGCHVVLVVTDGDDGSNPVEAARRIREACSRLFIVGVGLGDNAVGVLRPIAAAGGGRFCNGTDAAGLTRCVLSVFKRFQFDAARQACVDDNNISGRNPMPPGQRLFALEDWECYDFSGQDFTALLGSNRQLTRSLRGSSLDRAILRGITISGALTATRFQGADLERAVLVANDRANGVDLRAARLAQATIRGSGRDGQCARRWDFTEAQLPQVLFENVALCDVKLSGTLAAPRFSSARLDNLHIAPGLTLQSPVISQSRFSNVSSVGMLLPSPATLVIERMANYPYSNLDPATVTDSTFGPVQLAALQLRQLPFDAKRLQLSEVALSRALELADIGLPGLRIEKLRTPLLRGNEKTHGDASIADSDIGELALQGFDLRTQNTRIGKGLLTAPGDMTLGAGTSCPACVIEGRNSGISLRIDTAQLPGLQLRQLHVLLEAHASNLDNSQWQRVALKEGSAFDRVSLRQAAFTETPLKAVLRRLKAEASRFDEKSPLTLVDGSEDVEFPRASFAQPVDLDAAALRNLNFTAATLPALRLRQPGTDLRALNLSEVTTRLEPNGMACRDCRFDRAKLKSGSATGLTLQNASAIEAELDGLFDFLNSIEVRGSNFSRARIKGRIRGEVDQSLFSGATLDGFGDARVSRSRFDKATFAGAIVHSEFSACDFSDAAFTGDASGYIEKSSFTASSFERARFGEAEGAGGYSRVLDSQFIGANFSGTEFGRYRPWYSNVQFENSRFNGLSGPAKVKHLKGVHGTGPAQGLNFTNADLSGMDLAGWRVTSSEWVNVDLRRAKLAEAQLTIMKIDGLRLEGADLSKARLEGTMAGVRMSGADVDGLWLRGSLAGSDLSRLKNGDRLFDFEADLDDVDLAGSDIHNAIILHLRSYRQLHLDGATLSCTMAERIAELAAPVSGSYRAQPSLTEMTAGKQFENPEDPRRCRRSFLP